MWIVRLALRRPYTFVVLAILILILGTLSALRTPTDIFPNINIPVVSIIWNFTGMVPADMASRIVILQERIGLDENVAHGMLVVAEARQRELARDHAAAEPGVALEDQDLLARRRQIGGRHQAVVTRSHGHDVRGGDGCVHLGS